MLQGLNQPKLTFFLQECISSVHCSVHCTYRGGLYIVQEGNAKSSFRGSSQLYCENPEERSRKVTESGKSKASKKCRKPCILGQIQPWICIFMGWKALPTPQLWGHWATAPISLKNDQTQQSLIFICTRASILCLAGRETLGWSRSSIYEQSSTLALENVMFVHHVFFSYQVVTNWKQSGH